ncbi:MAG: hypothetical protein CGU28_04430 [Candidatus Dactylopiibacterium carminicum]|uniref:Transmembrane protein n=1 Tax=Candidatus Dactylopiibacterium carminicum TaxID=857335 RepID=A0A272EWT0_9RHOO|nr:hypothetical protein [Candidatus Dactylopiibacterium carminicum]KAF7600038.1 hypothetical protein BGI27_04675 [Candidatus Dactylopiibacterium carminicum]PAS94572.1 MAG: hypothetical protein CGU29_03320 [Candidatus Dactylopiibacterium carminicum]PAS97611.1 MAG: hypothetical protein CGU28_04430 [Candidatus Dactylopiibacterium carminicum]PAT00042.1 MAG: hypothetical protein BSR46_04700 [Candidatus Dactylopiibacterium carminicum]
MKAGQALRLGVAGVLGAAYLWLGHITSASANPSLLGLFVGLIPLGTGACVLAWHTPPRVLWLTLCGLAFAAIAWQAEFLRSNAAWVYFIQHAGSMSLLGLMFGRTLRSGRHEDALCTRIAALLHTQPMSPAYLRYTWLVTWAWTLFFAASALLSILLFVLAPPAVWSVFANLLTPPLLGLMFAGEYLIRLRALPGESHFNIADTVRAWQRFSAEQSAHGRAGRQDP